MSSVTVPDTQWSRKEYAARGVKVWEQRSVRLKVALVWTRGNEIRTFRMASCSCIIHLAGHYAGSQLQTYLSDPVLYTKGLVST